MTHSIKPISKLWLRGMLGILGTTPLGIYLLFRTHLLWRVSIQTPEVNLRIMLGLSLTTIALGSLWILEHPWLRWDSYTGTWASRFSKTRYCAVCKAKKEIVPLRETSDGWHCVACNTPHYHPDKHSDDSDIVAGKL